MLKVFKSVFQGHYTNVHGTIVCNVSSGLSSRKSTLSKEDLDQSRSTLFDKGDMSSGNVTQSPIKKESLERSDFELDHVYTAYNGMAEENDNNSMGIELLCKMTPSQGPRSLFKSGGPG